MRRTIAALMVVLLVFFAKGKLSSSLAEALLHLGCLVIVGLVVGRLLSEVHVPKEVGFVLTGFLLGPELLHVVDDSAGILGALGMVFLGWVGFCVGSRLKLDAEHFSARLVAATTISVLVAVVLVSALWSVVLPGIYITLLVAILLMFPDPFWAFVASDGAERRSREGILRTAGIIGMGIGCLCWSTAAGVIRWSDGGSVPQALGPLGQLSLSIAVGCVWGELVYHLCGILKSRSAVMVVFLVSVLGVFVGAGVYPVSLMVVAVAGGIWTANRGDRADYVVEAISPVGYALTGPLFAIFGTQIPLGAVLTGLTWPVGLMYAGTMIVARGGASVLSARTYTAPAGSTRSLGCGAVLQGIALLEMVRWTQAALAGSRTFEPASDLFVGLAGIGMMAGSLLLPVCAAWVSHAERRE